MPRSTVTRITLIVLAAVATILLAAVLYPFASALLFAAVLAGAFHPWLERLSARLGQRRELAAALLTVTVALVIVLPASMLTVAVGRQVVEAVAYVGDTLRQGGVPALIEDLPPTLRTPVRRALRHIPRGQDQIEDLAENHTGTAAAAVGGVLVATSNVLVQIGLMLVAFYFLLVDGKRLVEWLSRAVPMPDRHALEIFGDFRNVSVAVLVSSLATAGVQAVVALAGYLIADVPQALFFTLVTFVVAFIPVLGAASVSLVLAGLLLVTGHTGNAIFLAIWGVVVVGLSDNLVKPLLMKDRMEVHGALIFFAMIGGLAMFGAVGLVAGPLILAFFMSVIRLFERDARLREP